MVKIVFIGDVYFGDEDFVLDEQIQEKFDESDILVANLEGPITDRPFTKNYKCSIKSSPKFSQKLSSYGIDIVSLANNHIFDSGLQGFLDTKKSL